jgi:hypothetical protein
MLTSWVLTLAKSVLSSRVLGSPGMVGGCERGQVVHARHDRKTIGDPRRHRATGGGTPISHARLEKLTDLPPILSKTASIASPYRLARLLAIRRKRRASGARLGDF